MLLIFIYLFPSFIFFYYYFFFLLHNFLKTLDLLKFPFITTDKNLRSAPVIYATILVHLRQRVKCTIVVTRCPSSVRPSSLTFYILDFSSETTVHGIQQNMTGSKISSSSTKLVFFRTDQKNKMAALADPSERWHFVLRCTPFGTLVLSWIYSSCVTLYIGKLLILCKPCADTISLIMKYNMFKGMVHFVWYIDIYISLHILFEFLLPLVFF